MSNKSARLNVRRECERADGNLDWAGKHILQVANTCEDYQREDLQEQAEYVCMMIIELKKAVEKLREMF